MDFICIAPIAIEMFATHTHKEKHTSRHRREIISIPSISIHMYALCISYKQFLKHPLSCTSSHRLAHRYCVRIRWRVGSGEFFSPSYMFSHCTMNVVFVRGSMCVCCVRIAITQHIADDNVARVSNRVKRKIGESSLVVNHHVDSYCFLVLFGW